MPYFKDMTPYSYHGVFKDNNVLNVGWISIEHDFVKGKINSKVLDIIGVLVKNPENLFRGSHYCEFCPPPLFENNGNMFLPKLVRDCPSGNGEIRIRSLNGKTYVAPTLIYHYIKAHDYVPPIEFINAVSERDI